jgi:lipid A 4'-phosphatase
LGFALLLAPKLDITFTHLFYHGHLDFIYKDHWLVVLAFKLVPIITTMWGVCCLLYLLYQYSSGKKILSSPAMYLLMAVLIGPGLLVNYGFKEHFGRARPKHILEFGGDRAFSAPFRVVSECMHNCSFSSGHAAMGYYFSSISYVAPKQYQVITFLCGILLGSIIGFGRVLQGGHFLSDVVFSGIFIILTNHICFFIWRKISYKPRSRRK